MSLDKCKFKKRFTNPATANEEKTNLEKQFDKKYEVYKCPLCSGFHLTTKKFYKSETKSSKANSVLETLELLSRVRS